MDAMGIYGNQEKFDKLSFVKCPKHPDICRFFLKTTANLPNIANISTLATTYILAKKSHEIP